jgi:hypothetical protein
VYYPFWRYAREGPRRLVPAWPTLETEWANLRLPDAEQVFFDPSHLQGAEAVEPTVPEAAARARVGREGPTTEGDLVHVPVYEAAMRLGETRMPVVVEACSGTVVCAGASGEGTRTPAVGRIVWMMCGGLAILAVAAAVRPVGIAAAASAALAVLLYGVLASEGRGSGS